MKTVFSNKQTCHVWAQQKQAHGRGPSIFFEGTKIYSYGHHFLAAEIHKIKGKPVALITTREYSVTTRKHKSYIWRAVSQLMPAFGVPDVSSLKSKANVEHFKVSVNSEIEKLLKKNKVETQGDVNWYLENLAEVVGQANTFLKLAGKKPIKIKRETLKAIRAHLEKRLARYNELNSPEIIAKKNAEKQRRAEIQLADAIANFRAGKRNNLSGYLPYDLLRIDGDVVKTSGGAEVPLDVARTMLGAYINGANIDGKTLGDFTVTRVDKLSNGDALFVIGCHKILLSEALAVLNGVKPGLSVSNIVPMKRSTA